MKASNTLESEINKQILDRSGNTEYNTLDSGIFSKMEPEHLSALTEHHL